MFSNFTTAAIPTQFRTDILETRFKTIRLLSSSQLNVALNLAKPAIQNEPNKLTFVSLFFKLDSVRIYVYTTHYKRRLDYSYMIYDLSISMRCSWNVSSL